MKAWNKNEALFEDEIYLWKVLTKAFYKPLGKIWVFSIGLALLIGLIESLFALSLRSLVAPTPFSFGLNYFAWYFPKNLTATGLSWILIAPVLLALFRWLLQWIQLQMESPKVYQALRERMNQSWELFIKSKPPIHRNPYGHDFNQWSQEGIGQVYTAILARMKQWGATIQVLLFFPFLFYLSAKLTFMALLIGIPAVVLTWWRGKVLKVAALKAIHIQNNVNQAQMGYCNNWENQRLEKSSLEILHLWKNSLLSHCEFNQKKQIVPATMEALLFLLLAIWTAMALQSHWLPKKELASIFPFLVLLILLFRPIREVSRLASEAQLGEIAWKKWMDLENRWKKWSQREKPKPGNSLEFIIDNLSFSYDILDGNETTQPLNKVFDHLSLSIPNTKVTWLKGPNGSGKSTLMRLIVGVERPESGQVLYPLGFEGIHFLTQNVQLDFWDIQHLNTQIMRYPIPSEFLDSKLQFIKILDQLNKLKCKKDGDVFAWDGGFSSLSGGQKQRLALATLCFSESSYLLLDEPATWLPYELSQSMIPIIIETRRLAKLPLGMLVSSHQAGKPDWAEHVLDLSSHTRVLEI